MHEYILSLVLVLFITQENISSFRIHADPFKPVSCETNISLLDNISYLAKNLENDEVIIVIVRLGKGERQIMNKRRLYTITTYLEDIKVPKDKLIVAEGLPSSNYGLIEFYAKGKPMLVLAASKNQELEVGGCQADFSKTKYYMPKAK